MKRFKHLFLALALVVSVSSAWADDSGSCGDNLNWTYVESTGALTITGSGAMTNYDRIGDAPWWIYFGDITSISLPEGMTTIGKNAFCSCNNASLTTIIIPSTVTSIGQASFNGCTKLTNMSFPEGLLTIPQDAFGACYALASVSFPSTLNTIGLNAFGGCRSLTSIEIPEAVDVISSKAFRGCTGLTDVTIHWTDLTEKYVSIEAFKDITLSNVNLHVPYGTYDTYAAKAPWNAFNIIEENPYSTPLTFEAMEAGAIVTYSFASASLPPVEYSTDGSTWTSYSSAITLANIGDKVFFRGNNATYRDNNYNYAKFSCSKDCYIYGNIMSLVDATNYVTATTLSSDRTFMQMFKSNTHIKNHPTNELVLPATTLTEQCYNGMFSGCTGMTSAPALPATTLANSCYNQMFYGCTGMTSAPALPASTMTTQCYRDMFRGCTALTSVPELPATTLADQCYNGMFNGCTGLTTLPENLLPATTLAEQCYNQMFYGCTGLTTLPENLLSATTLAQSCCSFMFENCTGLTTLPENLLPATTLAKQCYRGMFRYCTGLTTLPKNLLPATTLAQECYQYMFYGCTSLTNSPALPATTLALGSYAYMFYNCTDLSSVTCLATARPNGASDTSNWLSSVAASGTFYAPIDNVFAGQTRNASNIPSGWTLKNIVPAKEDPQNNGVYYSTLYHGTQRYALQDDGTEAYVATLSNDALLLTKIAEGDQVLPENTAVILKSATPTIIIEPTDAAGVTFSAVNDLLGVNAATAAPANCYVLSGHSTDNSVTGVGFYQFSGTLGAHKAYLTIPSGSPAPKRISFAFDNENTTTDIEATANAATQGAKKMLRNGQLIILLDGVEYNAQGQLTR